MNNRLLLIVCVIISLCTASRLPAQSINQGTGDTVYIKVHFLYGSKPLKKYKETERKWFGGIMGGHVGIEGDSGRILNFRSNGNFHLVTSNKNRHSRFDEHTFNTFYAYFGSNPDSVKRVIVTIPVTHQQLQQFDSIGTTYLHKTPYDYALMGMRCGAAAYEILGQLGILENYSRKKTYMKIFYPEKLRRRLLSLAEENNWIIERQQGSARRKWEKE
jgi:hypothetical protein